jgi:hypothetical protein
MNQIKKGEERARALQDAYDWVCKNVLKQKPAVPVILDIEMPAGTLPVRARGTVGVQKATVYNERVPAAEYTRKHNRIVIHPQIFNDHAPRYVIRYLVYHKLIHHVHPPLNGEPVHGDIFRAYEGRFADTPRAIDWLRKHDYPVSDAGSDSKCAASF